MQSFHCLDRVGIVISSGTGELLGELLHLFFELLVLPLKLLVRIMGVFFGNELGKHRQNFGMISCLGNIDGMVTIT